MKYSQFNSVINISEQYNVIFNAMSGDYILLTQESSQLVLAQEIEKLPVELKQQLIDTQMLIDTTVIPKGQLQQEGKSQTTMIERFNNVIRQRCSRFVRKPCSFSKKYENFVLALKFFLTEYNLDIIAKNPSLSR